MAAPLSDRVMVDPSLLLSTEGFAWLQENPTVRDEVVVSETVMRWFQDSIDLNRDFFIAPEDLDTIDERRERLGGLFAEARVPTFSYRDVQLSPEHAAVLQSLLEAHELPGLASNGIYADEWAFLQSQSSLISKLRNPLDAFRDAGSSIVEFGRDFGWKLVRHVIPAEHVPSVLTPAVLAKVGGKWTILGGAYIGGGTLGGMVGAGIGGPLGAWFGGKIGGGLAEEAVRRAVVLAIDP